MTRWRCAVWCVSFVGLVLCSTAGRAWAAEPPPPVTSTRALSLAEALRLLEQSPQLRLERVGESVARAEIAGAGVHPNPTLSYTGAFHAHGRNTFDGTAHQVTLEQPLLLSGQRGARTRAAEAGARAARARTEWRRHDLAVQLRRRFAEALAASERARILSGAVGEMERVTAIVRGRRDAGERSDYDVIRMDVELEVMRADARASEVETTLAILDVTALLGRPSWTPALVGDLAPFARAARAGSSRHPAEGGAQLALDARNAALDAARRERAVVPSVAAGIQSTTRDYGSAVVVGLAVPLPVFDRAQGVVARAAAEQRLAAADLAATRSALAAERARAEHQLRKRRQALARFEATTMARAPELRRMAEDAYRDGQTTVLELLDALATLRQLGLQHLEHRLALVHAEIDWLDAHGLAATP